MLAAAHQGQHLLARVGHVPRDIEEVLEEPDPARGERKGSPLLPESDLYSLAVTMIYALGGDIEAKRVPASVPDSLCDFIKKLLVRDVLNRPNWQKEDLCETISKIRQKEFGRKGSNMKPIKGLKGG